VIFTDKEESFVAVVDLVGKRQKPRAFQFSADFVDADCGYVVPVSVSRSLEFPLSYGDLGIGHSHGVFFGGLFNTMELDFCVAAVEEALQRYG
jgi:hypothetical protein